MEKQPKFIKRFSKERSGEERSKIAAEIKEKRREYFDRKNITNETVSKLDSEQAEKQKELETTLKFLEKLGNELDKLSDGILPKLINYFKIQKTKADIQVGEQSYEELKKIIAEGELQKQKIENKVSSDEKPELIEAKQILQEFYETQKNLWEQSDFTKEDITENFSDENLSQLSLDEYVLLMQRFPGEMVTHVTRQGVRDHIGDSFHNKGLGEFSNGFVSMLQEKKLRSPLGIALVSNEKDKAIISFLKDNHILGESKEESINLLSRFVNPDGRPQESYADTNAVHFASEQVADIFYGAEKGNEIFVAYPSAYISSQYYFTGDLADSGGGAHNDQWVWESENKGMNIDSGIVFIPEEAKVDIGTGSRYEMDSAGKPTKDLERRNQILDFINNPKFKEFSEKVLEITGGPTKKGSEANKQRYELDGYRKVLESDFNIEDERLQSLVLNYSILNKLNLKKASIDRGVKDSFETLDMVLDKILSEGGLLYAEAKMTISSKEYWENYFKTNPAKRPSKIVYYKGDNPTKALMNWKKQNGIENKAKSKDLGFPERTEGAYELGASAGVGRFRSIAEKVISEYFEKV